MGNGAKGIHPISPLPPYPRLLVCPKMAPELVVIIYQENPSIFSRKNRRPCSSGLVSKAAPRWPSHLKPQTGLGQSIVTPATRVPDVAKSIFSQAPRHPVSWRFFIGFEGLAVSRFNPLVKLLALYLRAALLPAGENDLPVVEWLNCDYLFPCICLWMAVWEWLELPSQVLLPVDRGVPLSDAVALVDHRVRLLVIPMLVSIPCSTNSRDPLPSAAVVFPKSENPPPQHTSPGKVERLQRLPCLGTWTCATSPGKQVAINMNMEVHRTPGHKGKLVGSVLCSLLFRLA